MNSRIFYLDFLKGASIFFVVLLHVAALGLAEANIGSFTWVICNIVDSCCRFVVPVFVMISGALLLNENKEFNLKKSVSRLLIPLFLWSLLYALIVTIYQYRVVTGESVLALFQLIFITPTHNWFLFMLIGVYLATPLLRPITRLAGEGYLIAIWMFFGVLVPFMKGFEIFSPVYLFMNRFSMTMPLGYIGYFILGYMLSRLDIQLNKRCSIILLSVLSVVAIMVNVIGTHLLSVRTGNMTEVFYDYLSPMVVVYSVCVFLLAKVLFADNERYNNCRYCSLIILMSKYSLAIYMLHVFILILAQKFGIKPTVANPLISVPVIVLGIYVISFVIIHLCSRSTLFRRNMM